MTDPTGQRVRVERGTNPRDWEDWQTLTLAGTGIELTDDPAVGPQRFHRAVKEHSDPRLTGEMMKWRLPAAKVLSADPLPGVREGRLSQWLEVQRVFRAARTGRDQWRYEAPRSSIDTRSEAAYGPTKV